MTSKLDQIFVRATSPDNELEVRKIVELFKRTYGEGFPIKGVYDAQFWRSHIGSRFISMLGLRDGKIIGHIAYGLDKEDDRCVQIVHPVCDTSGSDDAENLTSAFGKAAWQVMNTQAQRQKWQAVYYFAFSNIPGMQDFSNRVLGTFDTGIMPGYLPPTESPLDAPPSPELARRQHLVVSARVIGPLSDMPLTLYVPAQHEKICNFLLEALPIEYKLVTGSEKRSSKVARLPIGDEACDRNFFASTGVCQTFVKPSALRNHDQPISDPEMKTIKADFIFVDARDSACPAFCQHLEEKGYLFGGMAPFIRGQYSLLYFRSADAGMRESLDQELFFSPRARILAKYIQTGEFPKKFAFAGKMETRKLAAGA